VLIDKVASLLGKEISQWVSPILVGVRDSYSHDSFVLL